jgi:uncharacterized protein
MGEVASYPAGTFSWVDLATTDVEEAKAFYGGLFGWDIEDLTSSQGTYTMCRLHGRDVAGIRQHAPGDGNGWDSSISVDDVDGVTARARELGATVLKEPVDMLGAGRKAVLQDPSGAAVALWQPQGHDGAGLVNEVGTWTWNELVTPDLAAAKAFYAGLFGWGAQDIPGSFPRTSFSLGDLLVGGGHAPAPQEGPAPRWTISFRVADADQSAARAGELGGSVLLPPMDIPVGRFAIVADPEGASFTVTAVPGGPLRGVDGS